MKMKKFEFLSIVLSIIVIVGVMPSISFASELSDLGEEIEEKSTEKEQKEEKSSNLKNQISNLQEKIDNREQKVIAISEKITNLENRIAIKQKKIAKNKKAIEEQENELGKRLRAMYEAGSSTIFDVMLNSTSITDFISNLGFIKKIHQNDSMLLKNFQKQKKKLATEKRKLYKEEHALNEQRKIQQAEEAALASDQAKIESEKSAIDSEVNDLEEDISAMQAESESIRQMLSALANREANKKAKKEKNKETNKDKDNNNNNNKKPSKPSVPSSGFIHPFPSYVYISSNYGYRDDGFHQGIDFAGPYGGTIRASSSGEVVYAGYRGSYGNCVFVNHGNGIVSIYAHMSKISVPSGANVEQGDKLGECGSTGNSTGNHLHYEIRKNGDPINPSGYY
jgi:murein DD-endopeptidase MepM/ murein hydrolase activator NlpD